MNNLSAFQILKEKKIVNVQMFGIEKCPLIRDIHNSAVSGLGGLTKNMFIKYNYSAKKPLLSRKSE